MVYGDRGGRRTGGRGAVFRVRGTPETGVVLAYLGLLRHGGWPQCRLHAVDLPGGSELAVGAGGWSWGVGWLWPPGTVSTVGRLSGVASCVGGWHGLQVLVAGRWCRCRVAVAGLGGPGRCGAWWSVSRWLRRAAGRQGVLQGDPGLWARRQVVRVGLGGFDLHVKGWLRWRGGGAVGGRHRLRQGPGGSGRPRAGPRLPTRLLGGRQQWLGWDDHPLVTDHRAGSCHGSRDCTSQ